MKNSIKVAFVVVLIGIICAYTVSAESYKTEKDPLVALSYVEKIKSQIYNELLTDFDLEGLKSLSDTDGMSYEVVEVKAGQRIMANSSCEIILRSGTASVVVTSQDNIINNIGLSDLTAGSELTNGSDITRNHYIIIPRGDGRGALISSETAYFMVRGDYEIVK